MSRKLRTAKPCDLIYIEEALKSLHAARRFIAMVGATKTKAKISSAIKSGEGAMRHTMRCLTPP